MKYSALLEVFSFNTINMLLIDRVKGAHVLMNCLMAFTKDLIDSDDKEKWKKRRDFVEILVMSVACALRLSRSIMPFLKDGKKFFPYILKLLKS